MKLAYGAVGTGAVLLIAAVGVGVVTYPPTPGVTGAETQLARLAVAPAESMAGYNRRKSFGGWRDEDKDCQDTRQEVLIRDMRVLRTGPNRCVVLAGTLTDPYTGEEILFDWERDAAGAQADHIVSVGDAWRSGARSWPRGRRVEFYNDTENLAATGRSVNAAKGDSGPAEWRPAKQYQCQYARRYTAVKARWSLTVTPADRDALAGMLDTCWGRP